MVVSIVSNDSSQMDSVVAVMFSLLFSVVMESSSLQIVSMVLVVIDVSSVIVGKVVDWSCSS